MHSKKNIKPVLDWANANGEAKITDRIFMKLLPYFLKENLQITEKMVNSTQSIEISNELYELVCNMAEELVGSSFVTKG